MGVTAVVTGAGVRNRSGDRVHEQFGDGIMSAINFRLDIKRVPDPAGDRVVVVLDGKFLPYQW